LLGKDIKCGLDEFFIKYSLVPIYLIVLALAYISAFLFICIGWYAYELFAFGFLKESKEDTIIALKWSLLGMLPLADLYMKIMKKKLNL